jgi:uncharacterized protein YbcI
MTPRATTVNVTVDGMPGFDFRYRQSGKPVTVETFPFRSTETLSRGDLLALADGRASLATTGDSRLVGAAVETLDGEPGTTSIRVVVDADAVYAVNDPRRRDKGASLDLTGSTGAQGVARGVEADLVVDVESAAGEDTLVRINGDRHYAPPQAAVPLLGQLTGGELNAAIARYHAEQLGRGPTKAHAFYRDNILVIVLEDTMTRGERTLVASGSADTVLETRLAFQNAMRPYLRSAIERLTGTKVLAFMSANHLSPDLAAEVFYLDRPVPREPDPEDLA